MEKKKEEDPDVSKGMDDLKMKGKILITVSISGFIIIVVAITIALLSWYINRQNPQNTIELNSIN